MVSEKVLLSIEKFQSGDRIFDLRVVQWGKFNAVLEKRERYIDDEGVEKNGKLKGFNSEDFQKILEKKDEIMKLLEKENKEQQPNN